MTRARDVANVLTAASALSTDVESAAAAASAVSTHEGLSDPHTGYVLESGGSTITSSSASVKGLVVKGASSQTANLQEWQNSSGTVIASIDLAGRLSISPSSSGSNIITATGSTTTFSVNQYGSINVVGTATSSFGDLFTGTQVGISTKGSIGLVVRGVASQTVNLQEWQNSAGTVLGQIDSAGNLNFLNRIAYLNQVYVGTGSYLGASMHNVAGGAGEIRLILKGTTSQTADLQQWQNSAGTVLSSINSNGSLLLNGKDTEIMTIMGAYL